MSEIELQALTRPPQKKSATPPPILLLLHGYGSNEEDLMGLAPYLDERLYIVSARAFYNIGFGYAWYHLYGEPGNLIGDDESLAASLEQLTAIVAQLPAQIGGDPQQVYLLGFSQGAVMSLDLALTAPQLIAGAIAISGYLDKNILPRVQPATLKDLDLLLLHGVDDDVIPVKGSRAAKAYLETTPAHVAYQEYRIGHGIHPAALTLTQQWLAERLDRAVIEPK